MNTDAFANAVLALERVTFGPETSPREQPAPTTTNPPPAAPEAASSEGARRPEPAASRQPGSGDDAIEELARTIARTIFAVAQDIARQGAREAERGLAEKMEEMTQELTGTRQGLERLAQAVSDHETRVTAAEATATDLRQETRSLANLVANRTDALSGRLDSQSEELSGLTSTTGGNSASVARVIERLDRQAEAIRGLAESKELERRSLEQLGEALAGLKGVTARSSPALPEDL